MWAGGGGLGLNIVPAVAIRRVRSSDWALLREIRLQALATDADAFGSSLEEEQAKPRTWWAEWATRDAADADDITFLAITGERPVGLAKAFVLESRPETAAIVAMWVEPRHRRRGSESRFWMPSLHGQEKGT